MAKQTSKPKVYDFEKYQYGALAGRLLASKENARHAPNALEILAGAKGLNLGEEALGFIRGTQASEKGIQTAISVYASEFEKKRGQYKPSDFAKWYAPVLADLEKKDKDKILGELSKHNETLKNITDKVSKAAYITNDDAPEGLFSDKQIEDAKKVMEKYSKLMFTLKVLDDYKFEALRADAVDETRKKDLKDLASNL
jgi:hypothetical protein